MRRRKIDSGWSAISTSKKKFQKKQIFWVNRYESRNNIDDTIFEKIVKFLIMISLFFTISKKNLLNKRKKQSIIDSTYDALSSPKFTFIPAGVAFYFFLSLIPIIVIVLAIINLTPWMSILIGKVSTTTNDSKEFVGVLPKIIPGIQNMFIQIDFMDSTLLNTVMFFFMISCIWFASKGISKFIDSFAAIYNYEFNTNWILKRFKGIFVVIGISLYFVLSLFTYLPLISLIEPFFHSNINLFNFLFYFITLIYLVIFGYIGFGFLFIIVPPFKLRWREIKPGILTALVPTILFILVFGFLAEVLNYSKFGAIGTFIYTLIFILYLSYFLHAGIILNASYYKTFFSMTIIPKKNVVAKQILYVIQNSYNWIKSKFKP